MRQFTCISRLSLKYRTQHQNIPYCFVFTCSGYVFKEAGLGGGVHKNYNRKTLYLITICNKLWHICEFMKGKKPTMWFFLEVISTFRNIYYWNIKEITVFRNTTQI